MSPEAVEVSLVDFGVLVQRPAVAPDGGILAEAAGRFSTVMAGEEVAAARVVIACLDGFQHGLADDPACLGSCFNIVALPGASPLFDLFA